MIYHNVHVCSRADYKPPLRDWEFPTISNAHFICGLAAPLRMGANHTNLIWCLIHLDMLAKHMSTIGWTPLNCGWTHVKSKYTNKERSSMVQRRKGRAETMQLRCGEGIAAHHVHHETVSKGLLLNTPFPFIPNLVDDVFFLCFINVFICFFMCFFFYLFFACVYIIRKLYSCRLKKLKSTRHIWPLRPSYKCNFSLKNKVLLRNHVPTNQHVHIPEQRKCKEYLI